MIVAVAAVAVAIAVGCAFCVYCFAGLFSVLDCMIVVVFVRLLLFLLLSLLTFSVAGVVVCWCLRLCMFVVDVCCC